ncbi:DUF5696 domain-containing protein [Paenibacillus sp. XY044]|uniref:DUF5696 domain-containing protein n=1 Tax=Paenibacillus sp. XY044 TaxID=2026089 RepID=UPI000B9826EF|nr:DUF5696 domain-containing protein [Paenibacillus sp. XY044]OZB91320.1 hypothetical protein CJP46_28965 [Paenibacillus sp. XY044]
MPAARKFTIGIVIALAIGGTAVFSSSGHLHPVEAAVSPAPAGNGGTAVLQQSSSLLSSLRVSARDEKTTVNTPEELTALSAMKRYAENNELELYMNQETTEIAVKNKQDGYVWFSNPIGRGNDPIASPLYKSEMSSQVQLTYYNDKGQINQLNSFDDSVSKKQFEIQDLEKGVKVVYQIGTIHKSAEAIPQAISKERFEELILGKLKDEQTRTNVAYKFKFNEEKQIYEVRQLQDYVAEELAKTLASVGYTKEDALEDNKANGVSEQEGPEQPLFTIPVEYKLEGDHLGVTVKTSEVTYPKTYPLKSLQILKYFGAADGSKSGYMFVPDGSGALIRLNNNKLNAEPYQLPVYGEDGTFDVKEKIQTNQPTRLPVFGMKQNDHAFVGIIESGDALAEISADISGRFVSYNNISSMFNIVAMDFYTLTSGTKTSSVPMFQTKAYQGDIQIRYAFLTGANADYTGMAARYRDDLAGKYKLKKIAQTDHTPFVLELAGAFQKQASFLGIPYEKTESLTSYSEAVKLLKMLKDQGVDSLALRYVGWFNNGIRHRSPSSISLESALGGKRKFRELIDYTQQNGIGFYPDAAFLEKYSGSRNSALFLDRSKAKIYDYDPVMYVKDTSSFSHYVLAPAKLPGVVDGFIKDYKKFGITGLSLRDLASEVNSDFNQDHPVNRQDARERSVQETSKLKKNVSSLMVNGGNAYALPAASIIVGAPTESSRMNITDEVVPFYQIALHGYFDIAGSPFNMDEQRDPRNSMLKALETGSDIYYEWFYSKPSAVKETPYDDLNALYYEDWLSEAVALYKEADPILAKVRGQLIIGHRKLADQVVRTDFENGVTIYVNYNKTAVDVDGLRIAAQSYRIGGE